MKDDSNPEPSFWRTVGIRLQPHALAWVEDLGTYLMVWASVLVARLVRVVMVATGVDTDIVKAEAFMEKWVAIASFGAFFLGVIFRLYQFYRDTDQHV